MTAEPPGAALPGFLAGGGVMAARIAAFDWAATPLGPIAGWSPALRTTVSAMLGSKIAMCLAWGPELITLHNDAYLPNAGGKDLLGRPLLEPWPEVREQIAPVVARALAGEGVLHEQVPLRIERHGRFDDGWFTFTHGPVRDEHGVVRGVLSTVVETTATVRAQRRREFLLALADGLRGLGDPAGITLAACRLLGEHLQARRAGYADIDLREDAVDVRQGWHDGSVESVIGRRLPLSSFGAGVVARLRAGRTVRVADADADPDCTGAEAYRRLSVRAMLIVPLSRDGQLVSVLAVGRAAPRPWHDDEITLVEDCAERTRDAVERARADRALQRRAELERDRLRVLFDRAPSFMCVLTGPDHVYELENEAHRRLVGHRPLLGRALREALPEVAGQGYLRLLDEVRASGRTHAETDARVVFGSGADAVEHFIDFAVQPLCEADGEPVGLFVVGYDVTERKRAGDALRDADRRKDEFLAMLAHELRNPLAPIRSAAELLRRGDAPPALAERMADIISRQVAHMTGLVDELLDVARVTRGLIRLAPVELDLGAVVRTAVEQVRPLIEARRHRLQLALPAAPVPARGDHKRLVQVLANLLENAAKYSAEGGLIEVALTAGPEQLTVTVRDHGVGIPAELQAHMFELFAQGRRDPDRAEGGLGIGLALVRRLLELHGGSIRCDSAGAGCGATFTVTLPAAPVAPATRPQTTAIGDAGGRPLSLLLVDDNRDAAEMLALALRLRGHRVEIEHDPTAVPARLAELSPDACVLDIGMPVLDGCTLARQLRADRTLTAGLLVALTGYGREHDRTAALAAGFDLHLVKPADADVLIRAISVALAQAATAGTP